ncbi:MAG TPA: hypothetical protein VK811_01750 [Candidatus Acidoferrum sp.]|nr:hypothetical protein [Candidatus Acidoferrum sp.]
METLDASNPRNPWFQPLPAKADRKPTDSSLCKVKNHPHPQKATSVGLHWNLELLWSLDVGVWMFPSSSPSLTCLRLSLIFLEKEKDE